MKIFRIYQNRTLHISDRLDLNEETSHRVQSVLRISIGQSLILFNGDGYEYLSKVTALKRKTVSVEIVDRALKNLESPLEIHLGQVISKGEKMEFVIQKATELGVRKITPLFSEHSVVHFKADRLEKKQEHWQKIAIHAAEQCGRTVVPTIEKAVHLNDWLSTRTEETVLVLEPSAKDNLRTIKIQNSLALLIGPEGGLSESELQLACDKGFSAIRLGPRILRTETAALAAISVMQCLAGDL